MSAGLSFGDRTMHLLNDVRTANVGSISDVELIKVDKSDFFDVTNKVDEPEQKFLNTGPKTSKLSSRRNSITDPAPIDSGKFDENGLPTNLYPEVVPIQTSDWETIEVLFDRTSGNMNWNDLLMILRGLNCQIQFEGGYHVVIFHEKLLFPIWFRAPHPDLTFKSFEVEAIKCILQDHLGVYYENFCPLE